MTTPLSKGDELELAVRAIESAILQASPSYSEKTFKIESKKIVVVQGTRHEIDVWVEVELGKGYQARFVFECKNWEDKVGKNEIIIFSEKIRAVQAQRGFFVAKSFTRDAKAQAAKDPRVELHIATELSVDQIPVPFDCHYVLEEERVPQVQLHSRSIPPEAGERRYEVGAAQAVLDGQQIDFSEYLDDWTEAICSERNRTFPSAHLPEGVYELEASGERCFELGELIVNEQDIAKMLLQVNYEMRVVRPPIVSHFEVATRGRVLSLAPVQIQEGAWAQISFSALS